MAKTLTLQLFRLALVLGLFCVFDTTAQSSNRDIVNGGSCELEIAGINNALNEFAKTAGPDSYLIIVGGAMKVEKAGRNSRRLQQLIEYMTWGGKSKSDRFITAVGSPEADSGYLRFYVNGTLSTEMRTRKNAALCWGDGTEIDFSTKD